MFLLSSTKEQARVSYSSFFRKFGKDEGGRRLGEDCNILWYWNNSINPRGSSESDGKEKTFSGY